MPGRTSVYSFIHVWNEQIFWDYEYINWVTVDNQLNGLYTFVGKGIVDGWEVQAVSEDEVAALSDEIKNDLEHTSYCMMFKVTAGDGVIGVYAAYTPETIYKAIPILPQSNIYYVYAVATDCLPTKHRADIFLTTDSNYDSTHRATYLDTIITYYDPDFGETYIYRIYNENNRRVILKDLEGPALKAIQEKLYRHKHIGQPTTEFQEAIADNPSKIALGSEDIENLTVVASSTIFLIKNKFVLPKDITNAMNRSISSGLAKLPKYEKVDIKINGAILSTNDYYLDNIGGKLYLKNSVEIGDIVQVVKYQDPAIGQIARGPQDDPASVISGGNITVVTGDAKYIVHDAYKLPKNRVGDIDASKIVFGTLPVSKIEPIDHYGMQRIRESAIVNPRTLTRTKDQTTYYLVPPEDTILGYDTEVLVSFNSNILGNLVSTVRGLYKVSDVDYQTLVKIDFPDDIGRIIKIYDNNIEGDHEGGNQFAETYVLTDEGEVWYTQDTGLTWEQLDIPAYTGIFVNCFTVSTDKVERIVKNRLTWDYYKVYHLGTNIGLFSARFLAAKGTISGGTEPVIVTVIPWIYDFLGQSVNITALQEVITGHSYVTENDSAYWYDRTLYIGTENGFYIGNKLVSGASNIIAKDILWGLENTSLLVLGEDDKVYITHTFEHIQTDDGTVAEDSWKHPLSEVDEELHISYSFVNKTVNRLSQEFGRRKYFVGLNEDIAVSSLDIMLSDLSHMPFLDAKLVVAGSSGLNQLNAVLTLAESPYGISVLGSRITVLSLANVANQLTKTDAEKEIADGWSPLGWNIPVTDMENTQTVNFHDKTFVEYGALYGNKQQPTDYYVSSYNGIWKSKDGGLKWERPVLIWDTSVIPYIERNGLEVPMVEYNLNHNLQAIIFKTRQKTSDTILVEKDFNEYFAVNGGWEQASADVALYIDGELSSYPYLYDMTEGKFIFDDKLLGKTSNVTFSLVDIASYITDIGITPHSEVLDAFIASESVITKLAEDLVVADKKIKVLNTSSFPTIPHYIQIEDEKFYVKKIDLYTFEIIRARNNAVVHPKGKEVIWLEVKRQYGIDDYISAKISGQTYNIFSLYVANLLKSQMAEKRIYEDIYDNVPHYPPVPAGSTVYQGLRQSLIHIGGLDSLDDASSVSTLWNGLDIPSRIDVATPRIVTSMLNPGTSSFIVGSDKGIWKFDGSKWQQLSKIDNASIVHYVVYDSRKGQAQQSFLIAGADNGLWTSSDNGVSWIASTTLYEEQLSYIQGTLSWWDPAKKYEIYGKNNGLAMVVYGWDDGAPESFHSDHFDPVDNKKVYGFYQGIFYRIDEETGQKKTFDSIWVMSEEGLYLCYTGTRYYSDGTANPYSSLLKGVEPIDPGYRTETNEDVETGEMITIVTSGTEGDLSKDQRYIKVGINSKSEAIYEKLKFFGAFQDSRPKTVPLIFLTNDGLRIARNWRWIDPDDLTIYLAWEASPLSIPNVNISSSLDHSKRITCNCFTTGIDTTIDDTSKDSWRKYKCFVGTNNGVYRSYNGCYDLEPCQKIAGVSVIYTLKYDSGRLYAGTDNGWWYSDNDGDDWAQPIIDLSNVDYIDGSTLIAQTFIPEYNEITKVGLYLHPKG